MKHRTPLFLTAVLLAVLLLGAGIGYWLSARGVLPGFSASRPQQGASATTKSGRKVLYWYDPMVPNVKFDKPGKSPFMDMQLVPMHADEAGEQGGVRISPAVTQSLGIRLGRVEKARFEQRLDAVGSVAFDERLLELIQARVEGYVTRLYIKAPFERVRRGQPLAEIQAPQWLEAQAEYLALLDARSERAQAIRAAARQRLLVLGVPEATVRRIESTRATHPTTTLYAPIEGVVTELSVREGSAFMAGAPLFRINGLTTVWVNAQIPEAQVSMVPMGSSVTARATAWPGTTFKGRVLALLPDVNPETRTLTARLALENTDLRLAPGMYVQLAFAAPATEPQLVVPSEAVIMTGERSAVIVAREGGGFDVANVRVGSEADGRTPILEGVQEGQSVVLSGQFLIDSEASLRATISRLEAVGEPAAAADADGASRNQHLTQGIVRSIEKETITIEHEPVPSLKWPAMTMGFAVPSDGLPAGMDVGDRVSFSFSQIEGGFRIEDIAVLHAGDTTTKAQERSP